MFKKLFVILSALVTFHTVMFAHNHSIQEQLGYPKETKLLIIHGDDIGVAHSQNIATFESMKKGVVTSTSVMMNTPWVMEVVNYSKEHPEIDVGVHITLTAEWETYKWGPLAGKDQVPSLVNDQGVFHSNTTDYGKAAKIDEVETEVRAQIEYAKELGIDFTHFDGHMGVMGATDALKALYLELGKEYGVPLRLHSHSGDLVSNVKTRELLINYVSNIDAIYGAPPSTFPDGMGDYYNNVLRNLTPGLNLIVLHVAYDDPEMQAITVGHPLWGARWRQNDFDWAVDENTKRIIKEEGIVLIDWREIKEKLFDQ